MLARNQNPIPRELKDWVSTLNYPLVWDIVEYFVNHTRTEYNKMVKDMGLWGNKKKLNLALKKMSMYGLIDRYEDVITGSVGGVMFTDISYYELSPIGKDLVNNLLKTFEPSK